MSRRNERNVKMFCRSEQSPPVLHHVSMSSWWWSSLTLPSKYWRFRCVEISRIGELVETPAPWRVAIKEECTPTFPCYWLNWQSRSVSLLPGVSLKTDTDPADFLRYHRRAEGDTGVRDTPRVPTRPAQHTHTHTPATQLVWWHSNVLSSITSSISRSGTDDSDRVTQHLIFLLTVWSSQHSTSSFLEIKPRTSVTFYINLPPYNPFHPVKRLNIFISKRKISLIIYKTPKATFYTT